MNSKKFGKEVKQRRTLLKIDQKALSEISGIAVHTISDIESGKGNPTLSVINKLLNALGMEIIMRVQR